MLEITPASHPKLFGEIEIIGYKYYFRKHYGLGFQEKLQEAYHEAFAEHVAQEQQEKAQASAQAIAPADGVPVAVPEDTLTEEKYNEWINTRKGSNEINRIACSMLFIPAEGAPDPLEVYDYIDRPTLGMALGFTRRLSDASTNEPTESNDGTPLSPDTEASTSGQSN